MLKRRDEKLSLVPEGSEAWRSLERKMDERAVQLEASRDLSRVILHADMDMFYAAVELKRDPSLKGKAFGVGKGVLVTASYEARQYGVRSGMASHIALALCPHLITVKNDMESYVAASKEVMAVFEDYDPTYAQMSLDEAYLDVTMFCEMNQMDVDEVVKQLREQVATLTGLTVSVGIAPNKMLAKISSDRNKPNGQFRVKAERDFIISLMQDLPCRKIPGIGRVTERILSSLGVETCGDIWSSRVLLHLVFDDIDWLLNAYLGIHSNVVEPAKRGERRSVGREHTFKPTSDPEALKEFLKQSATQVAKDLDRLDYRGKTVTLTCKTDAFRRFTRAKTTMVHQYKAEDLYATTCKLLDAELLTRGGPFPLRLIGVRVSGLKDLREPDKGGLKRMFEKVSTSPQKRSKAGGQELLEGRGDDDGEEYARTLEASMTGEGPMSLTSVTCPICQRGIGAEGHSDVELNALLNTHIDQCLNDSVQIPAPVDEARGKKKEKGPLDSFVLRRA